MFRPFLAAHGNKDVVVALEEALADAKAGTLVGVVLCGVYEETEASGIGWGWSHKDDLEFAWPRLLSSVASAHDVLVREGLVE